MTPEERAEAAWTAGHDASDVNIGAAYAAIEAAVRSAITVKLTPEILVCMGNSVTPLRARQRATAMFRAAGFIVEE